MTDTNTRIRNLEDELAATEAIAKRDRETWNESEAAVVNAKGRLEEARRVLSGKPAPVEDVAYD